MRHGDAGGDRMADKPGWGIIGTGKIARIFAKDVQDAQSGSIVVMGSRSHQRAAAFAKEFGVASAHGSYQALIVDPRVDYVYVATPHTTHVELAMQAASAGKHVLCEKPMAVDAGGAARMIAHAREHGTFLMEAFAFRCHPQTHRLIELLRGGEIGEVRSMSATFGYDAGPAPTNYLLRRDLAGGSILDVGCYTVALTRQLAGVPVGQPFRDATRFVGAGLLHAEHGVDLDATAVAWFAGGFTGQLACSIRTNLDSSVLIIGTEGWIRLPTPWLPGRIGWSSADRDTSPPRASTRDRHRRPSRPVCDRGRNRGRTCA